MIARGADVEKEVYGIKMLAFAVIKQDPIAVDILLKNKANPNVGYKGASAAYHAVLFDQVEILQMLLSAGADITDTKSGTYFYDYGFHDYADHHTYHHSYHYPNEPFDGVLRDLKNDRLLTISHIKSKHIKGRTLLHHAAEFNSANCVKFLLSQGLNPLAVDQDGNTPLHLACKNLSKKPAEEVLETLIEAGKDAVNIHNSEGKTPLHIGIRNLSKDSLKLLLDNGADPRAVDEMGFTAFDYLLDSYEKKYEDAAELFLNPDSSIFTKEEIHSISMKCCEKGNSKILDIILKYYDDLDYDELFELSVSYGRHNVLPNLINSGKLSLSPSQILFKVCDMLISEDTLNDLISKGADVNYIDPDTKESILYKAVRCHGSHIINSLISAGADITYVPDTTYSTSILEEAVRLRNTDVIRILLKVWDDKDSLDSAISLVTNYQGIIFPFIEVGHCEEFDFSSVDGWYKENLQLSMGCFKLNGSETEEALSNLKDFCKRYDEFFGTKYTDKIFSSDLTETKEEGEDGYEEYKQPDDDTNHSDIDSDGDPLELTGEV